ncbi:MAG: orotidine-5'-phosphate decarboxylase [Patescibacteria group bacterium]
MNSDGKIWVALDTEKSRALEIAKQVAPHPAIFGFKVNRLIDQEVFRKDGELKLFEELAKLGLGKPIWADLKLHDIPRTVVGRLEPYVSSGLVQFVTVMAKGEIDMMAEAVEAVGNKLSIIAVTELTSLSEEQVQLGSGHPTTASVINLARNAVLAGVEHLVCSSQELEALAKRRELKILQKFVPGIVVAGRGDGSMDQNRVGTPTFALQKGGDKLVIGSTIVHADNPLEKVEKISRGLKECAPFN